MNYRVELYNLPTSIKALTVKNSDGGYTIFINCRMNYEQQQESFKHELNHIQGCHFKFYNVDRIEGYTHGG